MAEYILSQRSRADILGIYKYTVATWSEEQADKYYCGLLEALSHIASRPLSVGASYEHVRPGCRGFHYGRHIIFFRTLASGKIRIIRILHDRMDFQRHL